jgi:hypothetical protein
MLAMVILLGSWLPMQRKTLEELHRTDTPCSLRPQQSLADDGSLTLWRRRQAFCGMHVSNALLTILVRPIARRLSRWGQCRAAYETV